MEIKFKKLVPEAKAPLKVIDIDAGFDLFAATINETSDFNEYGTGIAVEIPEGYVGLVFPRSSITKYDLMLKNGVGVIDASYRGEIRCRFHITKDDDRKIEIINDNTINQITNIRSGLKLYNVGDRIAQIVFLELPKITMIEVDELSGTQRGSGGFGHTGK
ncbi:MAG: dUTP diphosphatase [Dehalococcoidia bacterium]|jgi:dUTP pyrophosphatase